MDKRLYRIEIKQTDYKVFNYFDSKKTYLKNMEMLKGQNKNILGYKCIKGQYKPLTN
jgi:hypothetical protein